MSAVLFTKVSFLSMYVAFSFKHVWECRLAQCIFRFSFKQPQYNSTGRYKSKQHRTLIIFGLMSVQHRKCTWSRCKQSLGNFYGLHGRSSGLSEISWRVLYLLFGSINQEGRIVTTVFFQSLNVGEASHSWKLSARIMETWQLKYHEDKFVQPAAMLKQGCYPDAIVTAAEKYLEKVAW